ncbi:Acg family FMN-binding oxidoreductase [Prauserella muralis]|uniref:Nitroreductase n=1 Tax=Prauserella muralis TaxID=588067 RepID=A0A2V4ANQ9_9PSEU|nr:nitroreductase family protein [Prauserella muralis]PXY22340.1 nitroreductase [Prauserella muralis]TWE27992.1 nitroreductase [Prauserella muralis]
MESTHVWSTGETDVLARAVVRAPSVHNTQPWSLDLPDGQALLSERTDLALPYHDPLGRDRSLSCGAAVANLELAMRVLGAGTHVALLPDEHQPDLVARLTAEGTRVPSDTDLHRYSAIARRRSYRHAFSGQPVSDYDLKDLRAACSAEGVQLRVLSTRDELVVLADMLEYAGAALQRNHAYQRELALWTVRDERAHRHGAGIARSALPASSLPWAGIVRPATALPDRETLASRLQEETVLVFLTAGDSRLDHLNAGIAMERTWLAAVDLGLAAAVQTQPLHLSEARSSFVERLGLPGYPQVLMRVGHPLAAVPQSPRRRVAEVLDAPRD